MQSLYCLQCNVPKYWRSTQYNVLYFRNCQNNAIKYPLKYNGFFFKTTKTADTLPKFTIQMCFICLLFKYHTRSYTYLILISDHTLIEIFYLSLIDLQVLVNIIKHLIKSCTIISQQCLVLSRVHGSRSKALISTRKTKFVLETPNPIFYMFEF